MNNALLQSAKPRYAGTVVELLLDAALAGPTDQALVCGGEQIGYAAYADAVLGLAGELRRLAGTDVDDDSGADESTGVIATALPSSVNACIAHFAVLASGLQLLPLNAGYTARELDQLLQDAQPRVLVADLALQSTLMPAVQRLGIRTLWIGEGDAAGWAGRGAAALQSGALPIRIGGEQMALLQYTGGTSGQPKGVNLRHAGLRANVVQREAALPTAVGSERILCAMPLFHSYGIAMGLYLAVANRGALVILPSYRREQVLDAMAAQRITIFPGSPTIYTGLMDHPAFAATDWSSLRSCYSGASALPVAVLERWERTVGIPIYEGYGQTEAGPVLSYNGPEAGRRVGSVGRALADTQIEIVDLETGTQVLGRNARGEIRARGPQIMAGYRGLPEQTAEALREGWLYTGDVGEIDDEGYLYIRDRKKDLVIVSGYNVYPREVEEALMEHPAVLEAAVIGRPDDYRGQVLHAHVVLRADGVGCTVEALQAHCAAGLAKYKRPERIVLVDSLPKTAANKIDKKAIVAAVGPP
jgi:long-chain acyl-CoA synthetase